MELAFESAILARLGYVNSAYFLRLDTTMYNRIRRRITSVSLCKWRRWLGMPWTCRAWIVDYTTYVAPLYTSVRYSPYDSAEAQLGLRRAVIRSIPTDPAGKRYHLSPARRGRMM